MHKFRNTAVVVTLPRTKEEGTQAGIPSLIEKTHPMKKSSLEEIPKLPKQNIYNNMKSSSKSNYVKSKGISRSVRNKVCLPSLRSHRAISLETNKEKLTLNLLKSKGDSLDQFLSNTKMFNQPRSSRIKEFRIKPRKLNYLTAEYYFNCP